MRGVYADRGAGRNGSKGTGRARACVSVVCSGTIVSSLQAAVDRANTFCGIKRLLGLNFTDAGVKDFLRANGLKVAPSNCRRNFRPPSHSVRAGRPDELDDR